MTTDLTDQLGEVFGLVIAPRPVASVLMAAGCVPESVRPVDPVDQVERNAGLSEAERERAPSMLVGFDTGTGWSVVLDAYGWTDPSMLPLEEVVAAVARGGVACAVQSTMRTRVLCAEAGEVAVTLDLNARKAWGPWPHRFDEAFRSAGVDLADDDASVPVQNVAAARIVHGITGVELTESLFDQAGWVGGLTL